MPTIALLSDSDSGDSSDEEEGAAVEMAAEIFLRPAFERDDEISHTVNKVMVPDAQHSYGFPIIVLRILILTLFDRCRDISLRMTCSTPL